MQTPGGTPPDTSHLMLIWLSGILVGVIITSAFFVLRGAWSGRGAVLEGETIHRLESLHTIPLPVAISEHGRIVFRNTVWRQEMPHAADAQDWKEWLARILPPEVTRPDTTPADTPTLGRTGARYTGEGCFQDHHPARLDDPTPSV